MGLSSSLERERRRYRRLAARGQVEICFQSTAWGVFSRTWSWPAALADLSRTGACLRLREQSLPVAMAPVRSPWLVLHGRTSQNDRLLIPAELVRRTQISRDELLVGVRFDARALARSCRTFYEWFHDCTDRSAGPPRLPTLRLR